MKDEQQVGGFSFAAVLSLASYPPVFAQGKAGQDVTIVAGEQLASAIVKVEKLTGYRIMFSYNDVRGLKAQGKVTSKEINKALTQLLGKLPLNYTVEGKFVTIRPKSVSPKVEVVAQDNVTNGNIVILQGKVLDDTGNQFLE